MNDFFLKFVAPFLKSTKETFRVMVSTEVTMHSPKLKSSNVGHGDLTALIGLTGILETEAGPVDFRGLLALSFAEKVYVNIASQMLGEVHNEYSPEIADAGAEIANIILGTAKPGLSAIGIKLAMTSPSTVRGKNHEISYPRDGLIVEIEVSSHLGDFFLDLCYQDIKV
jgi:CheY-specific phosphatase CheX